MKNKYPLSINFKTLGQYDVNNTGIYEILFFEWLIVKKLSFGSDEFFYQNKRVFEEIPIKRHTLDNLKCKFTEYGLIIENKGYTNATNYLVTEDFINLFIDRHLLPEYKKTTLKGLLSLDFKNQINVSKVDIKRILLVIKELEKLYNHRRKKYYDERTGGTLGFTSLTHNNKTYQQFKMLMKRYNDDAIMNSFICFVDDLINGNDSTTHLLNNFSSYNRSNDSFPVFEARLDKFNIHYSITN